MTDMPELKPCPFCGGGETIIEPVMGTWNGGHKPQSIICYRLRHFCGDLVGDKFVYNRMELRARTEEQAIAAWNTRADLVPTASEAMRCPEAAAMSAALRQIRETLPHVEVVQGADREIVNDLIRRADAVLAPAEREG